MVLVDLDTCDGFIIEGKAGACGVKIMLNAKITGNMAVIPQYQVYRARRERTSSQETYNIGCHVQGDTSTLMFLYAVVKYSLYRYKESLIEANNFQLSKLTSTDLVKNEGFSAENVYSRWITLSGQVEESWVKTPYRVIEAVGFTDNTADLKQGIKICTNTEPEDQNPDALWAVTKVDKEE
jgi:hypothetical protein